MSAFRRTRRAPLVVLLIPLALVACAETGFEPPPPDEPNPAPTYVDLSVGIRHACALDVDGRAFCWQEDGAPRLVGGGHRFRDIEAGSGLSCGLTEDDDLLCWGQLPDLGERLLPVPVGEAGLKWRAVGAGEAVWTCALATDGRVFCSAFWTGGGFVDVSAGETFRSISVGSTHACGVTETDAGFCWGYNNYQQLGPVTPWAAHVEPVPTPTDESWAELVAGNEFTCGTTIDGRTSCWGSGERRVLTADTLTQDELFDGMPQPIPFLGGGLAIVDMAPAAARWGGSRRASCGFAEIGRRTAVCWGDGSSVVNIGFGRYDWRALELGEDFACGLTTDGRILCWDWIVAQEPIPIGDDEIYYQSYSRLVYPDIEFVELPAPVQDWRDS